MGAYYQLLGAWLLMTYIFGFGQRKSILHRIFLKCLSCFEADDACDFLDVWADETRFARLGVSGPTCDLWRGQLAPSGSRTFSSSPFCPPHYHCFSILKVVSIAVVAICRGDSRHYLGLWLFLRSPFSPFLRLQSMQRTTETTFLLPPQYCCCCPPHLCAFKSYHCIIVIIVIYRK